MGYRLFDIEVTDEHLPVSSDDYESGFAMLLRNNGRPVAFLMEQAPDSKQAALDGLRRRINTEARDHVIAEKLRKELMGEIVPTLFPSVTVAVCTRNRPASLERCLKSLRSLNLTVAGLSVPFDIIVVDNAPSDDRTGVLVSSLPDVQYICEKKPGLNFARNRALKEAKGEIIAFLDDDVIVDSFWLEGLMEAWADHPDAGAFTGLVLPLELETEAQILFERHGAWRKGFDRIVYGTTLPGNFLYPCGAGMFGTGANMAFNRKVLNELGGFDDALDTGPPLPGGGDLDMYYRVIRGGHRLVYDPKVMVYHEHRRSLRSLRMQYWSWGLSIMAFITKSYRYDPSQRSKLRRLVLQWFRYKVRFYLKSLRGRYVLPPDMVRAEIRGAISGLLGGYARSQKRIKKIKRRFA